MSFFKKLFSSSKDTKKELYHYQIRFLLDKKDFSLENFDEKISRPIQDLFSDHLGMETGELYDIAFEEGDPELWGSYENPLGLFEFSFSSEKQFRWDDQLKELNETFPLVSGNLGVPFTMKGGTFSVLAEILLQNEKEGEKTIEFVNRELNNSYMVVLSKNIDDNGNSFGRFECWEN